ncbi:MAG TPA: cytochrome C oxidase subunit IV family protein [Vicinamibacterales bacterium]|jgi:cytochrome c oxidase subunit 4|nr:cytochrome C oxidase subunit IV family protein [Vicinamibacterales bacterium]
MSEHIVPRSVYYAVFVTLMVLTGLTVWVAYLDLGFLNVAVALGIAVTKAALVVLYFMHVRYSTRLTWVVVSSGFFWLGILIVLGLSDYLSRGWLPQPGVPRI